MDSKSQTSAGEDTKSNSDLSELVEKLRIQLDEKDAELEQKKQENKELSASLDVEKARTNEADGLKTELAVAKSAHEEYQKTILAYQMAFWKSFPSSYPCYYIKLATVLPNQFEYLYADSTGHLRSSGDQPFQCASKFKFTKKEDGSFTIFSMSLEKNLHTESCSSAKPVVLEPFHKTKFVLEFHQQSQQHGCMVDIFSLENDCYLSMGNQNSVVANLRSPPANKFLILPVVDGQ